MREDYGIHPSSRLLDAFSDQTFPYQGQEPHKAEIIIIGIDANYSSQLSNNANFFEHILEYHRDGVSFWLENNVHHPFLLESYPFKRNTGGVPYHRKFTWLGLDSNYASKVSFIELLPIPTTGRTSEKIFWELFDLGHAQRIDALIHSQSNKIVIVSSSLLKKFMKVAQKKYGVFDWLPNEFHIGIIKTVGRTTIFGVPHFSSTTYKRQVFKQMGNEIKSLCETFS